VKSSKLLFFFEVEVEVVANIRRISFWITITYVRELAYEILEVNQQ